MIFFRLGILILCLAFLKKKYICFVHIITATTASPESQLFFLKKKQKKNT